MTIFIKFLLVILSFFSLNSCKVNESKPKIKVGSSLALSSAGIFLAQESGYFADRGLSVEIIPFHQSGAPMTVLLDTGELDVGAGNITAGLFNSILSGGGARLVADKGHVSQNARYISLIVKKGLEVPDGDRISWLRGKKIGLTSLSGVSQQIAFDRILSSVGISLDDVEFVKLSYPNMNIALASGEIDAAVQIEPYVTYGITEGLTEEIASIYDFYPDQQSAAIIYSDNFMARKNEAVLFMEAYLLGVRRYHEAFFKGIDKDLVIKQLEKYIKLNSSDVWMDLKPVGLNPNGYLNQDLILDDVKWYIDKKYLRDKNVMPEFIDDSFIKQALKTIQVYE